MADEIAGFMDSLADFMKNNKVETQIEFPIEVSSIDKRGHLPRRSEEVGSWCSIRPVSDTKTYLGVYLGDMQCETNYSWNIQSHVLSLMPHANPAIYVPDLKRVVWGYESWWGIIESEEKLRKITDADIQNVWYVKALKELAEMEKPDFGVTAFDPATGCRPNSEMNEDGSVKGGPDAESR